MSKVLIKTYLCGSHDENLEQGEELGLTGEALSNFIYHATEVCLEYELDTKQGKQHLNDIYQMNDEEITGCIFAIILVIVGLISIIIHAL